MAIKSWLSGSLVRHFPSTPAAVRNGLTVDAALNERFSFQLAMRNDMTLDGQSNHPDNPVEVAVRAEGPKGWSVRVRRVGYVPMLHQNISGVAEDLDGVGKIPGYVPDPLFDETTLQLPVNETHAFWFTVVPPPKSRPGVYSITVVLAPKDAPEQRRTVKVTLHNVVIEKRWNFPVAQWFYNDALLDFHDCVAFDETYWSILPNYFRNMVEHGQDMVYVPMFTPPLDGVKRPSQLLRVKRTGMDNYSFDWRDVKRYVDEAKKVGIQKFEWSHLFTQWGVKFALRIYEGQGVGEKLLWDPETGATSDTYRRFLSQLLPAFHKFLKTEKLMPHSYFHLSDEPHGDEHRANYKKARELLRELAPWMEVMDALSQIEFAREKLTDIPVPSISTALDFIKEGINCWCYFCCGPRGRYLNRLMDTPLAKIRMSGWLFYRWPFQGFLHWGYNYWYQSQTRKKIDPFVTQDGLKWPGWAYGDCFLVYPGAEGPIDSIRWEVFAESLQDYALLQSVGVEPSSLKDLKDFQNFPKSEVWLQRMRKKILSRSF